MNRLPFIAVLLCAPLLAQAAPLASGAGRFEFRREGKIVPVWYFLPENAGPRTPIVFVMHGVNRDADRYRNDWMPHAEAKKFIVIAPEFSNAEFPGNENYSLGGMKLNQKSAQPSKASSYSFLEPIFEEVKRSTGNRGESYRLYGHSAGAQFVHRYLYFLPKARVTTAVAANAGWWTMPDPAVDFPYGLHGSGISVTGLKAMLQRKLTILLGTADTDPNDENLQRTPEAMPQGVHRFARGHTFFAAGQKRAAALGIPLGWQLSTATGIGHSDSGMSEFAVVSLFEK